MANLDQLAVQKEVDKAIMDQALWEIDMAAKARYPKVSDFDKAVVEGIIKALKSASPKSHVIAFDACSLDASLRPEENAAFIDAATDALKKARENITARTRA